LGVKEIEMKYKLTINDRFTLASLMPEQTSFMNLKVIEKLRGEIVPTEEELLKHGATVDEAGNVSWSPSVLLTFPMKDCEVGEIASRLAAVRMKEMDKADPPLLGMQHVRLYELFVDGTGDCRCDEKNKVSGLALATVELVEKQEKDVLPL
jgi:hypothetical protein